MMPCDAVTVEELAAELSVIGIDLPTTVPEGNPFDITATVENTGDASGSGIVEFTQDGDYIGDEDTGSVPAGGQTSVTISHSIESSGSYEICAAMVGGMGQCDTITVTVAAAKLAVASIDLPGVAREGEPFDVTATVENTGDASGSGTVEFTEDGVWIEEADTGSVPAGGQADVTISHSIEDAGDYEICAAINGGQCDTITIEDFFTFSSVNQSDLEECTTGWCTDPDLLVYYTPDMYYDRIEGEMRVYFSGGGEVEAAVIAYDIDENRWVTLGSKMVTSGDWKAFDFDIDNRRLYMIALARANNNGLDLRNGKLHWW